MKINLSCGVVAINLKDATRMHGETVKKLAIVVRRVGKSRNLYLRPSRRGGVSGITSPCEESRQTIDVKYISSWPNWLAGKGNAYV